MLFLFGEKVHGAAMEAGEHDCVVCTKTRHFHRIVETSYFCVFGLRLLPVEKVADYLQCDECGTAFTESLDQPSFLPLVQHAITYILLGYGKSEHRDIAMEICSKVTGLEFPEEQLTRLVRSMDRGELDFMDAARRAAPTLNAQGKRYVIEAAFLATHACCEIQHEDRLRINLIGNSLGVSLEYVGVCIEGVRSKGYYGIRRLLPTQAV